MEDFCVYRITNMINGKFYIGVHKGNVLLDDYYGSGIAITRAINKYGKDNFKKEVIFTNLSHDEAYEKEKFIVNDILVNNNNCYNMKRGGIGGWPLTVRRVNSWKGKSPEERKNIADRAAESRRHFYKTHPEKLKELKQRRKKLYQEHPEIVKKANQTRKEHLENETEEQKRARKQKRKEQMSRPEVRQHVSEGMKGSKKLVGYNNPYMRKRVKVYDKMYDQYKDLINYTTIDDSTLSKLMKKDFGSCPHFCNFFKYISIKEKKSIVEQKHLNIFSLRKQFKVKTWLDLGDNDFDSLETYYPISIASKHIAILKDAKFYFEKRESLPMLSDHYIDVYYPNYFKFLELAEELNLIKIVKKEKLNRKKMLDFMYTKYRVTEKEFNRNKSNTDKDVVTNFKILCSIDDLIEEGKVSVN